MTLRVLSCAEAEFAEAVDGYNKQLPGLGFEFAAEVKAAFQRIAAFPMAWPSLSPRGRRCLVGRFPFGVLYHLWDDTPYVIGVMHLRTDPQYWLDRLEATLPTVDGPAKSSTNRAR